MADVFLSYAHQDIKRAEGLAGLLEDAGLTVWWDRRMVAGDKIHDVIDKQIEKAKAVIVLWSPISVKSDWVRGEAQTAHELGKLVPIKIAKCQLPINYRGIHTPAVYRSRTQHIELAKILSDKYGTKIEFPVDSSDNFLTQLAEQRREYQKEYSELSEDWSREGWKRAFRLKKKYPLGATWTIGTVIIGIVVLVAATLLDPMWRTGPGMHGWLGFAVAILVAFVGAGVIWILERFEKNPTK
jgi:hypothetical protein